MDGKNDTGAKYIICNAKGNLFEVSTKETSDIQKSNIKNYIGVADANGKVIVPEEYAMVEKLNDRYIKLYKATEATESKEDALIFSTTNVFSISGNPKDGDVLYKGNWYIFDVKTGKAVSG